MAEFSSCFHVTASATVHASSTVQDVKLSPKRRRHPIPGTIVIIGGFASIMLSDSDPLMPMNLPFRNSFGSNGLRNDFAVLCRIIKLVLISYCLNEVNIVPTMRKHIDVLAAGVISKNSRVYFVCGLARLCQSHCNSRFESGATLSPHQSRCSKTDLSVD